MASEMVDPIDCSHPPLSWAVPLERVVHSINHATSARIERATAAYDTTTLPMRPLAAAQGIQIDDMQGCTLKHRLL